MYISYEEILHREPDFRVTYRFYKPEEGGRYTLPFQGLQFNFQYDADVGRKGQHFMIWPEFEDENQRVITQGFVREEGTARMWIASADFRDFHRQHIQLGTLGYFTEGRHRLAVCEVIELLSLAET